MTSTCPRHCLSGPLATATVYGFLAFLVGCTGSTGPQGPAGESTAGTKVPTVSELTLGEEPPGVNLTITGLSGATGPGGNFRVGDIVSVTFTVEKDDSSAWDLSEMDYGRLMISGPTFNYQRVLPEERDGLTASVENPDGSFTYTFPDPIPATYAAPINDTDNFGAGDGELTGQALLDGTYTVGTYFGWRYTVDGASFRDMDNEMMDFPIGGGTTVTPREVVKLENCNQCHESLRLHGTLRREISLCVLCHTSGAEDRNMAGVTIDFRVMIHKIHNGEHLPSVNGVATNSDGSRNYNATPQPYTVRGYSTHDYSDVGFPAWPNLSSPMPRDRGHAALSSGEQALEDEMRRGVTNCNICHGDPDGAGPLTAPAQGDLIYSQPTRRACGSCHDDIDWSLPYLSNFMSMPPQSGDSNCVTCHSSAGSILAVQDAHVHPLLDPAVNPGLNFNATAVTEAGTNNGDGTIDPGEKMTVTFTITDDMGANVDPADLDSMNVVISGPTNNSNMLLYNSFPLESLSGAQPYTVTVPRKAFLEYVGDSTGSTTDSFTTGMIPHWNMSGATTTVYVRTATGAGSLLSAAAPAPQNYIELADASGFARDDYIVIDDGQAGVEYLRVQMVEGKRLWFSSPYSSSYAPGIQKDHGVNTTVAPVTLSEATVATDYMLNATTGVITEVADGLGSGQATLVSYTTDFFMPATFGMALNHSDTLDETSGRWSGKAIVNGTYTVAMWGYRNLTVTRATEDTSYRATANADHIDFLVGSATTVAPYDLVSGGGQSCLSCHQQLMFHGGGRAGFYSCISCHGTSGSEDRPQYIAGNAPATAGVTINFRTMLHKIHMGKDLANASSYTVVGYGRGYPNNFSEHTYPEVVFPAMPGEVRNCTKCHGDSNVAWMQPADRNHPTEQGRPVKSWAAVCNACHDSDAETAHIAAQTSPMTGAESCAVCHGAGKEWNVRLMHKVY